MYEDVPVSRGRQQAGRRQPFGPVTRCRHSRLIRRTRSGRRENQPLQRHRRRVDRGLEKQLQVIRRAGELGQQRVQQDVAGRQLRGVAQRAVQVAAQLPQIYSLAFGLAAQVAAQVRQAAGRTPQQRIQVFQRARVAADLAQHRGHGRRVDAGQRRQAVEEAQRLGQRQRTQVDGGQPVAQPVGQRVAAGEEQLAPPGRCQQGLQDQRARLVGEIPPQQGQVVLEVVQHQQQAMLREQPRQRLQAYLVTLDRLAQQPAQARQLLVPARGKLPAYRGRQLAQSPAAHNCDYRPAALAQSFHDAPGQRALAGSAHPLDQRAGPRAAGPRVVQQGAHQPAQLRPPADQVADLEQRHALRVGQLRLRLRRLGRQGTVEKRLVVAGRCAEERCGRVFARQTGRSLAAADGRQALAFHLLAGEGQRVAGERRRHTAQAGVECACQPRRVPVADAALHGDHLRHALAQEAGGKAGRARIADRAVAGGEENQRHRSAAGPQRVGQIFGEDRHRRAVLVLHLDPAGRPVARQVQHVVGLRQQRVAYLVRMGHLQHGDARAIALAGQLHHVHQRLQLALAVQRRAAGLVLVGRGHRGQNAQRPGQRCGRGSDAGLSGQAAHDVYTGQQRRRAAIRQPRRLQRQRQQAIVGDVEQQVQRLAGRARFVQRGAQRFGNRAWKDNFAQRPAQVDQRTFACRSVAGTSGDELLLELFRQRGQWNGLRAGGGPSLPRRPHRHLSGRADLGDNAELPRFGPRRGLHTPQPPAAQPREEDRHPPV